MLLFDVVIVGAVLPTHFTFVNVLVNPPFPVFNNNINDLPAVFPGIVHVQLAVNVAVITVPFAMFMVAALPVLPITTTPSV